MSVEKSIALLGAIEGVEDLLASEGGAEGHETAGEEFGVDGDVGVQGEVGGGGDPGKTVEAGEDFVEDDGEAGPGGRLRLAGGESVGEELGMSAHDLDEGVLEERVTEKLLVTRERGDEGIDSE